MSVILASGGGAGAVSDNACSIVGKDFEGVSGDAGSSVASVVDASFVAMFMLKRRPIVGRDGNMVRLSFALPAVKICQRKSAGEIEDKAMVLEIRYYVIE